MENFKIFATVAIVLVSLQCTNAIQNHKLLREKRTSDQRLAELETLFALSKMNGKLVTVPIGFGKIDPSKLGRRRRSIGFLLRQLIEDLSAEEKLGTETYHNEVVDEKNRDKNVPTRNFYGSDELELLSHPHFPVKLSEE